MQTAVSDSNINGQIAISPGFLYTTFSKMLKRILLHKGQLYHFWRKKKIQAGKSKSLGKMYINGFIISMRSISAQMLKRKTGRKSRALAKKLIGET